MLGKLTTDQLKQYVFKHLSHRHPDVIKRPAIGEDCAVIASGEAAIVVTSDPITGSEAAIGALAVNVNLNDLATTGCVPIGLMLTLLAPQETPLTAIGEIMASAAAEAAKYQTEIIGGHTEYTNAVNQVVVSAVALGKMKRADVAAEPLGRPGQLIIMTKTAGLEGTAIIAYQHRAELVDTYGSALVEQAIDLFEQTNVMREGIIGAQHGAIKMHDVTEGGLLGAVWEVCHGLNCGCIIDASAIPVASSTATICQHYTIDPLRLISSGSMLMIVEQHHANALFEALDAAQISAQIIGQLTDAADGCLINSGTYIEPITPPVGDALYEVKP